MGARRWGAPIAYAALLYWISAQPSSGLPSLPPGVDKLAHCAMFVPLGAALFWASRSVGWAVALGVAYAAFDEVHQIWVPGRQASILDALADIVGVVSGVVVARRLL